MQQELLNGGAQAAPATPPRQAPAPVAGVPITRPPHAAELAQSQVDFGGGTGEVFMGTCPDCGSQLEFAEGCVKCHVCGYSECG